MQSAEKGLGRSVGARLAALRPRDHAILILAPVCGALGVWGMATSGGALIELLPDGILLLMSVLGGYRAYEAWTEADPVPQDE